MAQGGWKNKRTDNMQFHRHQLPELQLISELRFCSDNHTWKRGQSQPPVPMHLSSREERSHTSVFGKAGRGSEQMAYSIVQCSLSSHSVYFTHLFHWQQKHGGKSRG